MIRLHIFVAALLAVGLVGAVRADERADLRVLMLTGGEYHDFETLPPTLARRLTDRGEMTVRITQDLADLTADRLADVDVLLFNTCQQAEVPADVRTAVLDFVRDGRGLVAMHCSLWSFQSWPEWVELTGGFARGHDKYGTFGVTVIDPAEAVVLGLGNQFQITDEPYIIEKRHPEAQVLARTSEPRTDPEGRRREQPEPQIWTRAFGKGRVVSITFGHDEKSQSDESFLTLLHNAIRWSARRMPDTPHNELTASERKAGFILLFNGRDLDGWTGDLEHWTVENGELVGRTKSKDDLKHNQFLIYKEEFGDFFLKYWVKLRNHNSGVQFRSRVLPGHAVQGYQADIADRWYGSLYEEKGTRGVLVNGFKDKGEKVVVLDGWNEMTVRAEGRRIRITLNGVTTVDYEETQPELQPERGVIALQLHAGPAMEVRFRDIRIQPLDKK